MKASLPPSSLVPVVLAFARDLLSAEVARPLLPYPDWSRPCSVPEIQARTGYGYRYQCEKSSEAIRQLIGFMADPAAGKHDFRYPQDIRGMLEGLIRDHHLDIDHVTIRKGSPHILSCTKNDNSHHRALARRTADETLLGRLRAMG
ncbi:MAG: hypothetical protein KF712_06100 [Akkermansiaceae bacterium]|nr:hypothetical protein [Akkermansiaceae bacterium]